MLQVVYKTNVDFKLKDKLLTSKDYKDIKSLHDWRKWEHNEDLTHGEWVKLNQNISRFTTNTIYF